MMGPLCRQEHWWFGKQKRLLLGEEFFVKGLSSVDGSADFSRQRKCTLKCAFPVAGSVLLGAPALAGKEPIMEVCAR